MKKKIFAIVSICLVVLLAVAGVVLGFVQTNTNNVVTRPDAVYIMNSKTRLNPNGYGSVIFEDVIGKKSDEVTKIFDKFNDAYRHSLLVTIFSGVKAEEEFSPKFVRTAAGPARVSRNYDSAQEITVAFYYKNKHSITADGRTFEYNYLFFAISGANQKSTIMFGVDKAYDGGEGEDKGLDLELNGGEGDEYISYNYGYSSTVNLHAFYQYVSALI